MRCIDAAPRVDVECELAVGFVDCTPARHLSDRSTLVDALGRGRVIVRNERIGLTPQNALKIA